MYRQRKRDLNLKPNRKLDTRSSRGMIYENEELRMRTIAICEDVDRGHSNIKKLRKENDHLKREIWSLRDECEKLEEMLKKVCISANISESQLESCSKPEDPDDDEEVEDDESSSYYVDDDEDTRSDKYLKADPHSKRDRRPSVASVSTFDSDVGHYMSNMFGDGSVQQQGSESEIVFAVEDIDSVILNPDALSTSEVTDESHSSWPSQQFTAPKTTLEAVREESETNSPASPSSPPLPEVVNPAEVAAASTNQNDRTLPFFPPMLDEEMFFQSAGDDRKTPVIQITPASSPTSNSNESSSLNEMDSEDTEQENLRSTAGCIAVVPKTFKSTSEIIVGSSHAGEKIPSILPSISPPSMQTRSAELPRKQFHHSVCFSQSHSTFPSDQLLQGENCHRPNTKIQFQQFSNPFDRNYVGHCCCKNVLLMGGCQSEPSLASSLTEANHFVVDNSAMNYFNVHSSAASFLNTALCYGVGAPSSSICMPTLATLFSPTWKTVDKNLVIGFYGYSAPTGSESGDVKYSTSELKVQDIIDKLEAEFDPTLEKITGIRLIPPGRVFISLKSPSVVQSFLSQYKNDLVLVAKNNPSSRIRIHFVEGTTTTIRSFVLSGIPPEMNDVAIISVLNQFGQVVAPIERRNYKGVDISERIVKMHLVSEGSMPNYINVCGFEVKIKAENELESELGQTATQQNSLTLSQQDIAAGANVTEHVELNETCAISHPLQPSITLKQPQRKYGVMDPSTVTSTSTNPVSLSTTSGDGQTLKPHKAVTRSSSSDPRLESPVPGNLMCPFPMVEQKRYNSVACVGSIPSDQLSSNVISKNNVAPVLQHQQKVNVTQQHQLLQQQTQTVSVPNLQPPPKRPLTRLQLSSPGSIPQSPASSPGSPVDNMIVFKTGMPQSEPRKEGPLKIHNYKGFETRINPAERRSHEQLSPSSSYSPKPLRKRSGQFPGKIKREPLPWCGCWGLGCG